MFLPTSAEYIATNYQSQCSKDDSEAPLQEAVEFESQTRWKIAEFHAIIKQLTGLGSCQCRLRKIQINHIACAILVWNHLKKMANPNGKNYLSTKTSIIL